MNVAPNFFASTGTGLVIYPPPPSQPLSGWEVQRVYGLEHRWQWRAFTPGRGSVTGTALSEAVAKARAMRAHEELTA